MFREENERVQSRKSGEMKNVSILMLKSGLLKELFKVCGLYRRINIYSFLFLGELSNLNIMRLFYQPFVLGSLLGSKACDVPELLNILGLTRCQNISLPCFILLFYLF